MSNLLKALESIAIKNMQKQQSYLLGGCAKIKHGKNLITCYVELCRGNTNKDFIRVNWLLNGQRVSKASLWPLKNA